MSQPFARRVTLDALAALQPHIGAFVLIGAQAVYLVAKAYKLGERLDTPHRLHPKDAGDVYRLYEATSMSDMLILLLRGSGGGVPPEMDRHASVVVVERGDEFEPCVERVEVLAQGRDAHAVGVFELGDRPLGDVDPIGHNFSLCVGERRPPLGDSPLRSGVHGPRWMV